MKVMNKDFGEKSAGGNREKPQTWFRVALHDGARV
jgi:hypothetical protein